MQRHRFLSWSILVVIAVFGGFGASEVLVRLVAPQNLSGSWYQEGARGLVLNAADNTATHIAGDIQIRYRFNRWHQRGRVPNPRAVKVLTLGDSFTFGWLVEEHECFVGLLERRANRTFGGRRFQFLNAGTGGWGTADALAYLETYGALTHPKVVLLFINFDDVARSWRRGLYELRDRTGAALVARNAPVRGAAIIRWVRSFPGYRWLVRHSHLFQFLRTLSVSRVRLGGAPTGAADAVKEKARNTNATQVSTTKSVMEEGERRMMRGLLRRFRQWTDARHVSLFVVATGWPGRNITWLDGIAREEGIDFFDAHSKVYAKVMADRQHYTLIGDGHPNAAGHNLIGDAVWPWLEPRLARLRYSGSSSGPVRVR